jgi:hypothetical protein
VLNSLLKSNPAARFAGSATESYEVKNMTASSLHFVVRLFTAAGGRSLNRPSGIEPWGIKPRHFSFV